MTEPRKGSTCYCAARGANGHAQHQEHGGTGQQLDQIMKDLDSATKVWAASGHPYDGPEADAREAVFERLRRLNKTITGGPRHFEPMGSGPGYRQVSGPALARTNLLGLVQQLARERERFLELKVIVRQEGGPSMAIATVLDKLAHLLDDLVPVVEDAGVNPASLARCLPRCCSFCGDDQGHNDEDCRALAALDAVKGS